MSIALWALQSEQERTTKEIDFMMSCLPEERRERLRRIKKKEAQQGPLCAYLLLRAALWEQYGWNELPPMAYSSLGKPYFPDFPTIQFNISHTRGAVLVGLSDRPIGVDIERIRPVGQNMMQRLLQGNSQELFFQNWVRREARCKRTGQGIGTMLPEEPPLQTGEYFYALEIFPGYAAGVATQSSSVPGPVQKRSLDELLKNTI